MLKDGEVAETPATHSELIDGGGEYAKLWAGKHATDNTIPSHPLLLPKSFVAWFEMC